jgi:hypothetical protein
MLGNFMNGFIRGADARQSLDDRKADENRKQTKFTHDEADRANLEQANQEIIEAQKKYTAVMNGTAFASPEEQQAQDGFGVAPPGGFQRPKYRPDELAEMAMHAMMPNITKAFALTRNVQGMEDFADKYSAMGVARAQRDVLAASVALKTDPENAGEYLKRAYSHFNDGQDVKDYRYDPKTKMAFVTTTDAQGNSSEHPIAPGMFDALAVRMGNPDLAMKMMQGVGQETRAQAAEGRAAGTYAAGEPKRQLDAAVASAQLPQAGAIGSAEAENAKLAPQKTRAGISLQQAQAGEAGAKAGLDKSLAGQAEANAAYINEQKSGLAETREADIKQKAESKLRDDALKALHPGKLDNVMGKERDALVEKSGIVVGAVKMPENKDFTLNQLADATKIITAKDFSPEQLDNIAVDTKNGIIAVKVGGRLIQLPVTSADTIAAVSRAKSNYEMRKAKKADSRRGGLSVGGRF